MDKRELSPIKGVFPNPKEIQCYTCKYRDRATITLGGNQKPVGVTRDNCDKYHGKPKDVLFYKAKCPEYKEG